MKKKEFFKRKQKKPLSNVSRALNEFSSMLLFLWNCVFVLDEYVDFESFSIHNSWYTYIRMSYDSHMNVWNFFVTSSFTSIISISLAHIRSLAYKILEHRLRQSHFCIFTEWKSERKKWNEIFLLTHTKAFSARELTYLLDLLKSVLHCECNFHSAVIALYSDRVPSKQCLLKKNSANLLNFITRKYRPTNQTRSPKLK